jgi:hypothetical protein
MKGIVFTAALVVSYHCKLQTIKLTKLNYMV